MSDIEVTLIDGDPDSELGDALVSLLLSSADPSFKIERVLFPEPANSQIFDEYLDRLRGELLFVVLPSPETEQSRLLLQLMKTRQRKNPVVLVFGESRAEEIINMLRCGASDFFIKPLRAADILPRIWRILKESQTDERLVHSLKARVGLEQIVGQNPIFLAELEKIPIVANCDAGVLISGETGTGKELFARAVHYLSPRADKAFIPVSCGAIPQDLMENELFGHSQGAYTGASSSQSGLIQEAGSGTIFLDEIDCLPLQAQTKLLRFLQNKEYKPLGSVKTRNADVRIIAASNIDLDKEAQDGRFRRDLYYRLNVIPLHLPPLRDRTGDVLLLARHFLKKYSFEHSKCVEDLDDASVARLISYNWPGNIRELEHTMERAVIFTSGPIVRNADIVLPLSETNPMHDSLRVAKSKAIELFEKKFIEELLLTYQGNITASAKAAGKNRRAFWELIRKYRIDVESFRYRKAI